ncbi:hypothetical protein P153DRAFT_388818 [Dothidotthia symphoricarpi CBS 119687]|uniref:Uncharacterized protein n=1 Tax=Dothidotthia symphoricarpi CBS 119687 TaxID=1392245 RepID=A0A6A6A5L8_9PLEO|nr:uncharacterized protein P153DRAFT_388818 [Dothidotthia symphoricarpi CBS 119687]KAF2126068.1 hypothetical protein P153DRAFT_388818 [Dothidotthia symphoricarpi CBS 119687]
MAPAAKKNSRPIFKTSSPFTETKWPQISYDDQKIIIDLVCNLLTPLGDHRKTHIPPSRGKSKKRKRATNPAETDPPPPPPALKHHILIGLNSMTRHLEALASHTAPSAFRTEGQDTSTTDTSNPSITTPRPLSLILLTTPHPPSSPSHAHIPTLLHLANQPPSKSPPTLLVPLPATADALLAAALHIPRVGALGIHAGAPGAAALEAFARERVAGTECAWVDEAGGGAWRGVCVREG